MALQAKARETFLEEGLETEAPFTPTSDYFGEFHIQSVSHNLKEKFSELKTKAINGSPSHLDFSKYSINVNGIGVIPKIKIQKGYSRELRLWEGCITSVEGDTFQATLINDKDEEITAEFSIANDLSYKDDEKWVVEGNIFYWKIGYEKTPKGTRKNQEYIIFRKIPSLSNFDIENPSEEAKEFIEYFQQ